MTAADTTWLMEIAVHDRALAERARQLLDELDTARANVEERVSECRMLRQRATSAETRLLSLGQPVNWETITLKEELDRR